MCATAIYEHWIPSKVCISSVLDRRIYLLSLKFKQYVLKYVTRMKTKPKAILLCSSSKNVSHYYLVHVKNLIKAALFRLIVLLLKLSMKCKTKLKISRKGFNKYVSLHLNSLYLSTNAWNFRFVCSHGIFSHRMEVWYSNLPLIVCMW